MAQRHWMTTLVCSGLALLLGATTGLGGQDDRVPGELIIEVEGRERIPLPEVHFSGIRQLPNGHLVFRTADRWGIQVVDQTTGAVASHSLHSVPEGTAGSVEFGADFDVYDAGNFLIAGVWKEWKAGTNMRASVFIFTPGKGFGPRQDLGFAGRPERIAALPEGGYVVLAVDPACVRQLESECFLLHKYSSRGERAASFSAIPTGLEPSQRKVSPRETAARLRSETERGHLWVQDGQIFHILPVSRRLRVFNKDGHLVREAVLTAPQSTGLLALHGLTSNLNAPQVWRAIARPDGTLLVTWLHIENAGGGQRRGEYFALHGPDGRPLTKAALPEFRPAIPFRSDSEGKVYFLHLSSATQIELVRARLRIR
jgi:hypothetical protein